MTIQGSKINIPGCANEERVFVGECPFKVVPWRFSIKNITLYVTDRCNLRCSFCYENPYREYSGNTFAIPFPERQDFPREMVNELIEWVRNSPQFRILPHPKGNGNSKPPEFIFFGGEPLLVWDYCKEIMDKFKAEIRPDIEFHLATNGVLLTDEIVEYINKYNIKVTLGIKRGKYRSVSEDDFICKYPNYEAISRIKRLYLNTQFEPDWVYRLNETIQKLHELYPQALQLQFSHIAPIDWDLYDYDLMLDQLTVLYSWLMKRCALGMAVKDMRLVTLIESFCDHKFAGFAGRYPCGVGMGMISIKSNGDVYPCTGFANFGDETLKLGKIGDKLPECRAVLCSTLFCRLECADCDVFKYCASSCAAIHYAHTKTMHLIDESECKINRIYIDAAIKVWNDLSDKTRQAIYYSAKSFIDKRTEEMEQNISKRNACQ